MRIKTTQLSSLVFATGAFVVALMVIDGNEDSLARILNAEKFVFDLGAIFSEPGVLLLIKIMEQATGVDAVMLQWALFWTAIILITCAVKLNGSGPLVFFCVYMFSPVGLLLLFNIQPFLIAMLLVFIGCKLKNGMARTVLYGLGLSFHIGGVFLLMAAHLKKRHFTWLNWIILPPLIVFLAQIFPTYLYQVVAEKVLAYVHADVASTASSLHVMISVALWVLLVAIKRTTIYFSTPIFESDIGSFCIVILTILVSFVSVKLASRLAFVIDFIFIMTVVNNLKVRLGSRIKK